MAYILLDESGDLGFSFNRGSSNYFLITIIFAEEKRKLEKIVRKIFRTLKKKDRKRSSLHAYHESPITRQRLLKELQSADCKIMAIVLNKKRVYTKLQDEKAVLYNYVTNILLDRLFTKKPFDMSKKVILLASRRETNVFLNENFKNYLSERTTSNHQIEMEIRITKHHEDRALQVADFVSWAIFRKYERGDDSYYNMIKELIIEETPLYP